MNRRKFFSLVGAAAAAASIPALSRSATPAPIAPDDDALHLQLHVDANKMYRGELGRYNGVRWKVETRSEILNEEWLLRVGEQMRDTIERNAYLALT